MRIGIPRALLYYKYKCLFVMFFKNLGVEVVLSPKSNDKIFKDGAGLAIDEACLPLKLFLGHVLYLKDKCDYILVPRIKSFAKHESVCVIFNGLFDVTRALINANFIDYDIEYKRGRNQANGFVEMGKRLGFNHKKCLDAYLKALQCQISLQKNLARAELKKLDNNDTKILVVAHPYNTQDSLIGLPVVGLLKKLGASVIIADNFDRDKSAKNSTSLAKTLYWTFNKSLVGAVSLYKDRVDGIVFLTAFPCGPDSLAVELLLRKIKNKPTLNLVIDEQSANTGLITRLESFMDIVLHHKKVEAV